MRLVFRKNNGITRTFRKGRIGRESEVCSYLDARDPSLPARRAAEKVPERQHCHGFSYTALYYAGSAFLRKCMGGICIMADQRGYDLMLCYASNTEYFAAAAALANHKVDGVILTLRAADDPHRTFCGNTETPFAAPDAARTNHPQADNDQVAAACARHASAAGGAKRIALLVGVPSAPSAPTAIRGYHVDSRNLVCQ